MDVDAGAVTTYTLTTLATNGKLFKNGTGLLLNDTFTQQDIAAGTITYTHDGSDTTSASFGFSVGDGTATIPGQTFAFTVTPVNDAPVSQDIIAGGDEDSIITGSLSADDSDSASLTYSLVTQAGHGSVTVNPDGSFSYRPDANYNGLDQFTFRVSDGTANSEVATVDLVINPVNDGPVNTVPGTQVIGTQTSAAIAGLSIADLDAGTGQVTTTLTVENGTLNTAAGGATVSGGGTDRLTLTGTLAAVNAALAGVVYAPDHGFLGTDTLTMATSDTGSTGAGGALTDSDKVFIQVGQESAGSPGGDSFVVTTGTSHIDAGTGLDTVTFDFKLTDATITWSGNAVIDTANSHTELTGVETYVFRDGTANNNDGDVLVDGLFYYSRNHDVWKAHIDADQHFHSFGWQEWRDPNAFFSTSFYLAVNQDVKGVDPLRHFDTIGWTQGRPGPAFDIAAYLEDNPDIAAAHVDPLAHFLANGAQEGRQPSALLTLATSKGFDYVYYLAHNPDVAAAHVDPLQHFNTIGWKEGRDPNALFDTEGYLATYADVKASGANPLEHYNQFGWQEGRDPSPDFDTTAYLDAYPDVAWGNTNPLVHYLQYGIYEGRQTFADGVWG
jgi:VCBS repeat-containing protein